jgi:hypothetical protein
MLFAVARAISLETPKGSQAMIIKQGFGFTVGQDFARAAANIPIDVDREAKHPRCIFGWIAGDERSPHGFLRGGSDGKVRVMVDKRCVE